MIYFLEDWRLAEELRDGKVPEFEKFIYFMLLSVWALIASSTSYIAWAFHPPTPIERILDFYIFVVSVTGLWTCYERNKEGDHRDFITRITCLGFPAYVRMSLLGLLIFIPAKLAQMHLGFTYHEDALTAVVNLLIWPYFYYRLYKTISIAAFPTIPKP